MTKQRSKRIIDNVRKIQNNRTPKQESEETNMRRSFYEKVKKYGTVESIDMFLETGETYHVYHWN